LVGLGLKALSIVKTNDRYDPVLWGQLVCGISLPYALNVTATVAGNWFPHVERDWAASYLYMAHPAGGCWAPARPPPPATRAGSRGSSARRLHLCS